MSSRERTLAGLVLGAVILGGGYMVVNQLVLKPLAQYDKSIELLSEKVREKTFEANKVIADRPKLERWRLVSLPNVADDVAYSGREYKKYLHNLLLKSGWADLSLPAPEMKAGPLLPSKKPIYTTYTYNVRGKATMGELVSALEHLYRTPLLHRVKSITVDRPPEVVAAALAGDGQDGAAPGGGPDPKAGGPAPKGGPGGFVPKGGPGGFVPKGGPGGAGRGGPQRGGARDPEREKLVVSLSVEALIVNEAIRRPTNLLGPDERLVALDVLTGMRGGPTGLALLPWAVGPLGPLGPTQLAQKTKVLPPMPAIGKAPAKKAQVVLEPPWRNYEDIARKNVFFGASPTAPKWDRPVTASEEALVKQHVFLDEIRDNSKVLEAFLRNRLTDHNNRLRMTRGFDTFRIRDLEDKTTLVDGKVLRIEDRDVYFQEGDSIYVIHIGQSLAEAMRRPLSASMIKSMNLTGVKTEH
jgi:hypothetical protein